MSTQIKKKKEFVCIISLKSYHFIFLKYALHNIFRKLKKFKKSKYYMINKLKFSKCVVLPKKKKRFTFLRSPHGHKRSMEQFEICHYKCNIELHFFLFSQTNDIFEDSKIFINFFIKNLFLLFLPNVFISIKQHIILFNK